MRRFGFWMVVFCGLGLLPFFKEGPGVGTVLFLGLLVGIVLFVLGLVVDLFKKKDGQGESAPPRNGG